MSIIGIGTDIVEVERMRQAVERQDERFVQHILHPNEYAIYCEKNKTKITAIPYLAKRFAAKEALSKALGTGFTQGVSLTDIETRNDEHGKPTLHLHGKAAEKAKALGVQHYHLSLSDEKEYAVAFVVLS